MGRKALKLTVLALLPVIVLTLISGCNKSKGKVETTTISKYQEGVPGGVVVETHKMTAVVTGVDAARRMVTLEGHDGKKTTIKCGPEIVNFDQIRVGDHLKVVLTEQMAVSMAADNSLPSDGQATAVTVAPKGAKPGAMIATAVQVTATVKDIDLKRHKATLEFADGSTRKVAVRKDVDLTQRKVGEKVVILATESLAVSIDKE